MRRRQTLPPEARARLQRILGQLRGAKERTEKMIAEDGSLRGEDTYPFKCGAYGATLDSAANELEQILEGFAPRPRTKDVK